LLAKLQPGHPATRPSNRLSKTRLPSPAPKSTAATTCAWRKCHCTTFRSRLDPRA
jgi:hypothetical protein